MGETDPDYPVLTRQQVQWMYLLCLQAAADRGLEAWLADGRLVFRSGDSLSFFNLARKLAALDSEAEWSDCVRQNLDVLLAAKSRGSTLPGGPTDDIVSRAYPQLYRVGTLLPETVDTVYHRELLPGVLELLVEDFPESFGPFTADVIADCGLQNLLSSAATNLAGVKPELTDSLEGITLFMRQLELPRRDGPGSAVGRPELAGWGRRRAVGRAGRSTDAAASGRAPADHRRGDVDGHGPDGLAELEPVRHRTGSDQPIRVLVVRRRVLPRGAARGDREPDIHQRLVELLTTMPQI